MPPPRHKRSTDEIFSEPQRLHKVLASCGFGSRRAMEEMILAGRITVNRMPAEVGQKVGPEDEVRINGELVKVRFAPPRPRILICHKPAGEIVTRDDPEGRTTVFERLPAIANGKWINVGRLDYNTEGLLLFTNSGELANRLMHPRYEVEREYAVRVMGRLDDAQMRALTTGIDLDDGRARCDEVADGGGDEDGSNHWYRVVLKEGRNREVRRLFESLGVMVSRLIRTRYGRIAMPTHLKRGDVAELEGPEVIAILAAAGLRDASASSERRSGPNGSHRPHPSAGKPGPSGRHARPVHPGSHRKPGVHAGHPKGSSAQTPYPRSSHDRGAAHDALQAMGTPGGETSGVHPRARTSAEQARGAGPYAGKQAKRGKPPRPRDGFKGSSTGNAGGPRAQTPYRPRVNFDEVQPQSNANALPFGHRTREEAGHSRRSPGSGTRPRDPMRPERGQRPAHAAASPRGDVDGNVALPATRVASDDES